MRRITLAVCLFLCTLLPGLFPSMAMAQNLRNGVEELAEQLIKATPKGREMRVAVADFPDLLHVTSNLGRYIANRLTTRLAQSQKFFVVERQRLGQVLFELRFSMTDLVDPEKRRKLGQMVGVDALVVGTISDLGSQVDVDARLIEVETSRMLLSAVVTISKDQTVTDLMERGREAANVMAPIGANPASQSQHGRQPRTPALANASKALKESAAALGKRATEGAGYEATAKGFITEYNQLIQEAQAIMGSDALIKALQPLTFGGNRDQSAGSVATAAKGVEVYMASFDASEAFQTIAMSLAERAEKGADYEDTAKGLVAEYNRIIQEIKATFSEDKFIQAMQELEYSGDKKQTAGAVTRAARKLTLLMGGGQQQKNKR